MAGERRRGAVHERCRVEAGVSAQRAAVDIPVPKLLLFIGIQAFAFTAIGGAIWVTSGRGRDGFVSLAPWETGYGIALALALIALSGGLAWAFPGYARWLVRTQARNYSFLKHRIGIGAIVFISICAGLGEEALFRGGLQTLLGDYLPAPLAIVLAAALFALIHFAKPLNSALIFAIGCLFGGVYWATGSLLTVIVAHTVYDVYALWALQQALHRMGIFDEADADAPAPLPAGPLHETSQTQEHNSGETL